VTGANPMSALAMLAQRLGAGGASGPSGQPAGGDASEASGSNLGEMASELHGADPAFLLKSLQQIKKNLSQLFVMSSMRLPNVSGQIAKSMIQLDRAIKEAQQAATTQSVVRAPLGFTMAGGNAAPGGPSGGPGAGGF